jgi:hypothetical protein
VLYYLFHGVILELIDNSSKFTRARSRYIVDDFKMYF